MSATDDETQVPTGGPANRRDPPRVVPGTAVGRYVVIDKIGAGGMGVVYSAWDPELDRRVAIKLLRPDEYAGSGASSSSGNRLVREARAMAALQHPNVVAVHDVGEHEGCVFVAMEFVQGTTLRQWQTEQVRRRTEILSVYARAGRGLQAAHEQGLVHRDFKPDNAMISEDGRVRTLDFGLVRSTRSSLADDPSRGLAEPIRHSPADPFATKGPIGTPRYMSPEQHLGETVDARSDQFSFCVALYEALYRSPPFEGDTVASVAAATLDGAVAPEPQGRDVPGWLREVLLKGLARMPEHRHGSMAVLLDALAKDPWARRRRLLFAGGASTLVVGLGIAAVSGRIEPKPCSGFESALGGVWDEARKAEVAAAMLGTQTAYAQHAWNGVEQRLDAWARNWTSGRRDACEAANVRRDQSPALMDRRVLCYDESLRRVRSAVEVLASADASVVERAVRTVDGAEDLSECADADGLLADVAPPSGEVTRRSVAEARDTLAQIEAREKSGKPPAGLVVEARHLLDRSREVGYDPLTIEVLRRLGLLLAQAGESRAAITAHRQAYILALRIQWLSKAVESARSLQLAFGDDLREFESAEIYGLHAEAFCAALGGLECQGGNHNANGQIARIRGDHELALDQHERAEEIALQLFGSEHRRSRKTRANLANDLRELGRYEESRSIQLESLEAAERELGPNHPQIAIGLLNLGAVTNDLGASEDAIALYRRALKIAEGSLAPDHPRVALVLNNLGNALKEVGRLDDAEAALRRALAIRRSKLPKGHPWIAATLHNLGAVLAERGELEEALAHQREALAIAEAAMGSDHPRVEMVRGAIARLLSRLGRDPEPSSPAL